MRMIDADAFIAKLDHVPMIQDAIKKAMDTMPSEVIIRCQDCKFGLGHAHNVKCDKYYGMGGYDDFCSRAERKEGCRD